MTAATLIGRLHAAGVQLTANGDKLHTPAPAGVLTPALRADPVAPQGVGAVCEFGARLVGFNGELPRLANRHESGGQVSGDGGAENEPA